MKRRALLAAGSVALFDRPVLGELLYLPERPHTPTPLPSRLGAADVDAMRELTRQLDAVAQAYGGYAEMLTPVRPGRNSCCRCRAPKPSRRA